MFHCLSPVAQTCNKPAAVTVGQLLVVMMLMHQELEIGSEEQSTHRIANVSTFAALLAVNRLENWTWMAVVIIST